MEPDRIQSESERMVTAHAPGEKRQFALHMVWAAVALIVALYAIQTSRMDGAKCLAAVAKFTAAHPTPAAN